MVIVMKCECCGHTIKEHDYRGAGIKYGTKGSGVRVRTCTDCFVSSRCDDVLAKKQREAIRVAEFDARLERDPAENAAYLEALLNGAGMEADANEVYEEEKKRVAKAGEDGYRKFRSKLLAETVTSTDLERELLEMLTWLLAHLDSVNEQIATLQTQVRELSDDGTWTVGNILD